METIGVNVNTIVANARTDELLGESQRLTAELQARSEELQVQQEELQRSNAELEEKAALLAAQNRDIETQEPGDRAGPAGAGGPRPAARRWPRSTSRSSWPT